MASLLIDSKLTKEQQEFVKTICNSSDALLTIINDILDFSKIEANKVDFEYRSINFRECIEQSLDLVRLGASEKRINLAYFYDPQIPEYIQGDSVKLQQIFNNLLSNALKFTEKGEIQFEVKSKVLSEKQNEMEILISDTGIGIEEKQQKKLFQSFSQGDASMTRRFGGTGLGLAICKMLIEKMGGSIQFKSELGVGTQFIIQLPYQLSLESTPEHIVFKVHPEIEGKKCFIFSKYARNCSILENYMKFWKVESHTFSGMKEASSFVKDPSFNVDFAIVDYDVDEDEISLLNDIKCKLSHTPTLFTGMIDSEFLSDNRSRFQLYFSNLLL